MQHVVPRASEPPKRTVLLRRTLIARVGFGALCLLIVAGSYAFATGWEVAVLRSSAAAAQREALASAHASAVHLVSRTLALLRGALQATRHRAAAPKSPRRFTRVGYQARDSLLAVSGRPRRGAIAPVSRWWAISTACRRSVPPAPDAA